MTYHSTALFWIFESFALFGAFWVGIQFGIEVAREEKPSRAEIQEEFNERAFRRS